MTETQIIYELIVQNTNHISHLLNEVSALVVKVNLLIGLTGAIFTAILGLACRYIYKRTNGRK